MLGKIEESIDQLFNLEGIEACILYRIDGIPIIVRAREPEHVLRMMFWLESQMKHVLSDIKEGMNGGVFYMPTCKILISPISKSNVLVTIAGNTAHQQLTSIEVSRTVSVIEGCV